MTLNTNNSLDSENTLRYEFETVADIIGKEFYVVGEMDHDGMKNGSVFKVTGVETSKDEEDIVRVSIQYKSNSGEVVNASFDQEEFLKIFKNVECVLSERDGAEMGVERAKEILMRNKKVLRSNRVEGHVRSTDNINEALGETIIGVLGLKFNIDDISEFLGKEESDFVVIDSESGFEVQKINRGDVSYSVSFLRWLEKENAVVYKFDVSGNLVEEGEDCSNLEETFFWRLALKDEIESRKVLLESKELSEKGNQ